MADAGVMRGVVLRALGASWDDLGSSWAPLGSLRESFWTVLGHRLGLRGRVGSGKDAKVKITVSLRNSLFFPGQGSGLGFSLCCRAFGPPTGPCSSGGGG